MRRIAGEKQSPVAHRLGDEAAHPGHALLQDRSLRRHPAVLGVEPPAQLGPDAIVGPLRDVLVWRALEVQARDRRRAHAEQREAPLVETVDELMGRRRRRRENAQPAERIVAFVGSQMLRWNRGTADAVKAVAPGDEIAADLVRHGVQLKTHARLRRRDLVHRHVLDVEIEGPARRPARRDQILHHFVLAVDGDRPTAGEFREVDPMPCAGEGDIQPLVAQAFAIQPIADARVAQEIDRALLEHPGAHALDDVILAAILEDDRIDAGEVQQVAQQQARGAGADDCDLCPVSHSRSEILQSR